MASEAQKALLQLNALEAVPVNDNQPLNESAPISIAYENIHSIDFVDSKAYASDRFEYFAREVEYIARLNESLVAGESFLSLLYSYRSVSRAVPQVQQHDQSNKFEIYERTNEVLRPEVIKMKQLMAFCDKSVALCKEIIEKITNERKKDKNIFPSQWFLTKLAEMFNLFMVIDAIKNMKTSLNNDFAMYKRALANMKKSAQSGEDETMENQKLYMFLATHDSFSTSLKKELSTIQCEDTLADLVNLCSELFDDQMYLLPETKHMLLKAMAFGLYLMDQDNATEKNNILKNKKIKLDRFGKIFKTTPVVPLFGDLSTTIVSILKKAKNIDDTKWAYDGSDDNLRRRYMLTTYVDDTRAEYRAFIAEFGVMNNEMKLTLAASQGVGPQRARHVYELMFKGVRLVSKWTSMVLEQSAWKFSNPTDPYSNADCHDKATDYEKVVRYNYSSAERFVLIEYISMIKTAKGLMSHSLSWANEILARHVYLQLQYFLSGPFAEIIAHATKNKKAILNALLLVRDLSQDLIESTDGSAAQKNVTISKKGKTVAPNTTGMQINARGVGTSESQLVHIRALLDSAFNEKAPGMKGGFMKGTDFNSQQVADMQKFFNDSYYYPYMLNLSDTLSQCGDLSELWFKEFYLELSKEIQFPIEMSLPWILTDHILESDAAEMMECVLFPLDLYNDAAHRSLHKLRARFLFDEIEAEVNLAFDQFIFKLSNNIFTHYKMRASSILLNKEYKSMLEEVFNDQRWDAPRNRYEAILQQRHVQLLGRSVDINKLLSQRMLIFLKRSLDVAISRYESSDLTGILDLKFLIEQNRMTHSLLSEYLALDPFDSLLAEMDEETSLTSFNGRIVTHTLTEFIADLIPNYCYNSVTDRFVKSAVVLTDAVQRSHAPKAQPSFLFGSKSFNSAFHQICNLHAGYIGHIHFSAMMDMLGRKYISVIFNDLFQNCQNTFTTTTAVYTQALIRGMPQSSKLPLYMYGMKGTFDYFSLILKPIVTYSTLKVDVFQSFREIGNTIVLVHTLDKLLQHRDLTSVIQTAPFLNLTSTEAKEAQQSDLPSLKDIMSQANDNLASSGTTVKFAQLGARVDELYQPRNSSSSLLQQFLVNFNGVLEPFRGEWRGAVPSNDVIEIDFCSEFYRMWSAIQFAMVTPAFNQNEYTTRELFGEGLQWAGCTIIHLLEQQNCFNAFDFSYHMINVAIVDKTGFTTVSGVDLQKLVENALFYRTVNEDIFQILQRSTPPKVERYGIFHPPSIDGAEGTVGADPVYDSYQGEHGTAKRIVLQKIMAASSGDA